MRILAIDYGEKRIGIALSDPLGITAQPYATLDNDGTEIEKLKTIISEKEVTKIIIGLPLRLDGTKSESSQKALAFAETVKNATTADIELVDERFSSREINARLIEFDVSRKKRKTAVDKLAATLLLETYLERIKL
ncbi:MAG: hypothetical protein A2297_03140 [Elusimicrobia bacterium RIFOXYB2_FULL_48_7]|nr:MAG: hypothetical protein A2297_03140 [Elusimicrobia bacterium RIFOXYB2_FULL_48_7]